jgi:hypothetical protein
VSAEPEPPLSPLGLTVHSVTTPALEGQRRTTLGRWQMLAVLAVCAAPVVASYFTYFVVRPQARTNYSTLITPPRALPEALPITDVAGQAVVPASLKGQWLLVVVSGAACDARCEKNLVLVRQLRETLGRDKDRVDKLWFVVDGGVPGEAVLKASGATAYRVPREAIAAWLEPADGGPLEGHVYLVDPMGQWMMRAPVDPDPPRFKRDVERLLRASASWDQPGR